MTDVPGPADPADPADPAESIARRFHEAYERLAPAHGYATRPESAVAWEDVPARNKELMVDVVNALLARGVIDVGRTRD